MQKQLVLLAHSVSSLILQQDRVKKEEKKEEKKVDE